MRVSENFQFILKLISDTNEIKPFDCGDNDLNEFLFEKAKLYMENFLATTFLLETKDQTVAFYTLLNDSLKVEEKAF